MKKLCAAILFLPLFCGSVWATDSVVLDVGMASGETKISGNPLASLFSHKTSGTSWGIGYQRVLENGLLFGGGYQNFEVSGEQTAIGATYKTKLQISGLYGAIGYSLEATENLFFQPGLRIGIGNNYEFSSSLSNGSDPFKQKDSGSPFGIILPLVYQLGKWNIGGQIQVIGAGFIFKDPTDSSIEIKSAIDTAFQLVAGYNFEL